MNYLLMHKNNPVLVFDSQKYRVEVLDEDHLPFPLQGVVFSPGEAEKLGIYDDPSKHNVFMYLVNRMKCYDRFHSMLLFPAFKLSGSRNLYQSYLDALACRAQSMSDCYWVKEENNLVSWTDVNLYTNDFNYTAQMAAMHDCHVDLEPGPTPEFTTGGDFDKAWFKGEDGKIYLAKEGSFNSLESRLECMVSDILDNSNVNHVHYEMAQTANPKNHFLRHVCKCECFTTEQISFLSGADFLIWCENRDLNPWVEALRIDPDGMAKMWIVDYLIGNDRRTNDDWGFLYDNQTMEMMKMAPLFDQNLSFYELWDEPRRHDPYCNMDMYSLKDLAHKGLEYTTVVFEKTPAIDMFIKLQMAEMFFMRANELKIRFLDQEPLLQGEKKGKKENPS